MDGLVTSEWVMEQQAALAAGVALLDPDLVLATEAPTMWQAFDRIERLAASAKTLLARRVDDSGTWRREGHRSPAEYLAGKAGTTTGRARADLETSKRLPRQPGVSDACRRGDLSPTQAEAVSDAAARFNAALDPIIDEIFGAARQEGRRETYDAYAFDALIELADRARGAAVTATTTPTPPGGGEPRPRPSNPTHLALLRLDLEGLVRGAVEGEERCEITGVGPIPVRVARALLGDAILKLVITKGTEVAHITHLGRGPSAAQRVALLWASPRCAVEDCHRTRVEIDHRIPWAQTHHTRLDELDPLCSHHHALKTNQGWALVTGSGRRPLVPPDHPRHPTNLSPPSRAGPARPATTTADPPTPNPLFPEAC